MVVDEMYKFVGLLMYMSCVKVEGATLYRCGDSLLNGLRGPPFTGVWRYKCLMSFSKKATLINYVRRDQNNITSCLELARWLELLLIRLIHSFNLDATHAMVFASHTLT